jgi:alpha-L-arabinofuranosidase
VPSLDVVVARSADGRELYVKVVNTDPARTVEARFELRGVDVRRDAVWDVLAAGSEDAYNSFSAPETVTPRRVRLEVGPSFSASLPPGSVSVITMNVGR